MYIAPSYSDVNFERKFLEVISGNTTSFIGILEAATLDFVYINKGGATLFGYDNPESMLETGKFHLTQCRCDESRKKSVLERIGRRENFEAENEYVTAKGQSFWGKTIYTSFDFENRPFYYVQIEKTDRVHQAEDDLHKEQKRFEAFLEYASVGVITVNKNGHIVIANPFACELFGYQYGELLRQPLELLIPSRYRQQHQQHHINYYASPKSRPMGNGLSIYGRKKDGAEFPLDISLGTYTIAGDVFVIAFIADITQRKKNEEAIRKMNLELEEKIKDRTLELKKTIDQLYLQIRETEEAEKGRRLFQQLFHQVVDNYPNGTISVLDKEFNYVFYGGADTPTEKIPYNELIGQRFLHHLDHSKWDALQQLLQEVFEGKTLSDIELPGSSDQQTYSFDSFPLLDDTGNINRIAIITRNVSALKKVQKELQEALVKEKELSNLKSRFISIASHEFRTPLSTVLSSAYLLEKYTSSKEQPKREKHIERIVTAVNSLTDILNDFLSVGRIEEGKINVKPTNFSITRLVESIIDELKPLEKKDQVVSYTHSGPDELILDPSILKHIVTNLLSNAQKFSGENKHIRINTVVTDHSLQLEIADEGIGIPESDLEHLYERFFRAANATAIQGTGLGLHIVARYTELLEGAITCHSILDKGTVFKLDFPLPH